MRASFDIWSRASRFTPELASELRVEGQVRARLRVGAAAGLDLGCPSTSSSPSSDAEALACDERTLSNLLRAALQLTSTVQLTAQAQHDLLKEHQRLTLWLLARRSALTGPHARLHLRYRDDELARTLACSGELRFALGSSSHLALHVDAQLRLSPLSAAVSTGPPNPVLSLGATYDLSL